MNQEVYCPDQNLGTTIGSLFAAEGRFIVPEGAEVKIESAEFDEMIFFRLRGNAWALPPLLPITILPTSYSLQQF